MKPLFNFQDPKFNEGFSFDISKITPEQREHFNQIINARGITQVKDYDCEDRPFAYVDLQENTIAWYRYNIKPVFVITYPELCRGAVQLEDGKYCVGDYNKLKSIWTIAQQNNLPLKTILNINGDILVWENGGLVSRYYNSVKSASNEEISPEEFEAKLRGISPVVRETEILQDDEPQGMNKSAVVEVGKYYKGIYDGTIVKCTGKGNDWDVFAGVVVFSGHTANPLNKTSDAWIKECFLPCDYDEQNTTEKQSADNAPSMGIDDHANLDVFHSIEDIKQGFERLVEQNKRLKQKLNIANPQLLSVTQTNTDLTKQVEELTQQVFDLKRENSQLKSGLAAQSQVWNAEPVYDVEWLMDVVGRYNPDYSVGDDSNICVKGHHGYEYPLSSKDSAPIIMAALAKEVGTGRQFIVQNANGEITISIYYEDDGVQTGQIGFENAQKAIDILNQHFPQVLKNYFQL